MATIELRVPDIGDFKDVEVIELLVAPGDHVQIEQSLLTVESDKASMEIPASSAGRLLELKVKLGDKVNQGSLIAVLESVVAELSPAVAAIPAAAAGPAVAAPASSPAPAPQTLVVPDIGDFKDVEVIELLVQVGDVIALDQSLMTVESDKASMEIPSAMAGVVTQLLVKLGDRVSQGSPVVVVTPAAAGASASAPTPAMPQPAAVMQPAAPAPQAPPVVAQPAVAPVSAAQASAAPAAGKTHASPSVRKFARELGVDLTQVHATGPKGRITPEDVRAFVKGVMTRAQTPVAAPSASTGSGLDLLPWPKVDFAKFGPVDVKPLPRIRRISAANLHRNWVMIPHVTNQDEADVTDLEAFRVRVNKEAEKSGVKVTMLAFLIKACVHALKRFPEFNSSLEGEGLVLKRYWHIGFAADTPNGLVVPVIRDADRKTVSEIARESSELAARARDGKLGPADMQGGTFSISSLGGIGGTGFTPIVNAPEVAILGVSRTVTKPVWNGSVFEPRLILPLSLSYDHRVIDGAAAARFNAHLGQLLADFRRVML